MATLTIDKSREYVIFQAFSNNSTYKDALTELEAFDRENPDRRIFASAEEKRAMRESYRLFKDSELEVQRGGMTLDYDNKQVIERLKTVLSQKIPAISREVLKQHTDSPAINKANVGRMMAVHARNIKVYGKKELSKFMEERQENRQAMVDKYRKLGRSPYEGVFSKESSYKPIGKVLKERESSGH